MPLDYAGPFQKKQWPEVISTQSTTSVKTFEILRSVFARNGVPDIVVRNNGPQFTSELVQFTKLNEIKHVNSAPYYTITNGGKICADFQTVS